MNGCENDREHRLRGDSRCRSARDRRHLPIFLRGRRLAGAIVCMAVLAAGAGVAAAMAGDGGGPAALVKPEVSFASGCVSMMNSSSGNAIVSRQKMVPGDRVSGQVVISNKGRRRARFYLRLGNLTDTPGPFGGRLSEKLVLTVERLRGARRVRLFSGEFADLSRVYVGLFRPRERRRFVFTVSFPDAGAGQDSKYIRSSMSVVFEWSSRRTK